MLIVSLALASMLSAPTPEQTARLGELQNDPTVLCYGVAKGRKSTPVRENYLTCPWAAAHHWGWKRPWARPPYRSGPLRPTPWPSGHPPEALRPRLRRSAVPRCRFHLTFSDVVAEVPRGTFYLGQRVEGENKVLVLSPTASGPIGLARHSFLVEVDRAKCSGEALFAPAFDTLKGCGEPLPGVAKNPSVSGADPVLHQGCYEAKKGAVLEADGGKTPYAVGATFFAGDPLDGKGVSAKLKVLDPKSGQVVGIVARNKLERVALSRCAGL